MKRGLLFSLLLALPLVAEKKAESPPPIPAELRAAFWRADAEAFAAREQLARATARMRAAQAAMQQACGDKFTVQGDEEGEPVCVAKQEPKH